MLFAPKCKKCQKPIKGETVCALGNKYHKACFSCIVSTHIFIKYIYINKVINIIIYIYNLIINVYLFDNIKYNRLVTNHSQTNHSMSLIITQFVVVTITNLITLFVLNVMNQLKVHVLKLSKVVSIQTASFVLSVKLH